MTEGRGNGGENMRLCLPLAGNEQAQHFPDFMEGQEDLEKSILKNRPLTAQPMLMVAESIGTGGVTDLTNYILSYLITLSGSCFKIY